MAMFGELFLSEILRKPVLDPLGEEMGVLRDVVIVKGTPLPRVDALVLDYKRESYLLPWGKLNLFNKRIISSNSPLKELSAYDRPETDLLASRDILDKQVVDANGAKVVRVNDIKFEGYESEAVMIAVDVGFRGILRRMGFEHTGVRLMQFMRVQMPYNLISWNYMQPLQPKLSNIALTIPRQMVADLHPADLADLIRQVSPEEGVEFIQNLDAETAAETITELELETQSAIIRDMDAGRAAEIIEEMGPDEAADIINNLSPEHAKEILENIEQEDAEDIQELLSHESDTAGGLMTNEYISYPPEATVREVIEGFRKEAEEIESVYYIYVIDSEERLLGVTSLRELILAEPEAKLGSIMETNIKTVRPDEDEMQVAAVISKYNLVALPVVDCDTCMLGVITVDDIVELLIPRQARRKRRSV